MDFSDALRHMRAGRTARREVWININLGLIVGFVVPSPESNIMPFLATQTPNGRMMAWQPCCEDLITDDWIVMDKEDDAEHG